MRFQTIRSSDNPRYKAARRLLHHRGGRRQDRIAVFGLRESLRAIDARVEVDDVFFCRGFVPLQRLDEIESRLSSLTASVWEIPEALIEGLEYGERKEGLLLIAKRPPTDLRGVELPPQSLSVVLESAEKPGNIGAIARTAVAAGADALILADPICDVYHPNCIRASLGCIFSLSLAVAPSGELRTWLAERNIKMIAARTDALDVYTSIDYRSNTAIILGSESAGLSDEWREPAVREVRLPMCGTADSLNVSVTAAVMLYEALRKRSAKCGEIRED